MEGFTPAALIGLCVGFLWGIGCSLAILYSIYLGGYRKAIKDSLATEKSPRYLETLRKIEKRRAKKKARAAQP
jgi:hypothetical protein